MPRPRVASGLLCGGRRKRPAGPPGPTSAPFNVMTTPPTIERYSPVVFERLDAVGGSLAGLHRLVTDPGARPAREIPRDRCRCRLASVDERERAQADTTAARPITRRALLHGAALGGVAL